MRLTATLLLTFFVLINFVKAQDVIDFKLLYDKRVSSTSNYSVSDNSIDFKNIDHKGTYSVKFIGEYSKRLTLKNLIGGTIILDGGVTAATDNKTIQIADCKRVTLDLTNGTVTGNGLSTGVCGQLIYIYGRWQNITIKGGKLHQNGKSGGAAFQVESYSDPNFNHGTLIIDGLTVTKAMGEGIYALYNQPTKAYLDTLIIRNTNISNTRRDFWQWANVRYAYAYNNVGNNGALEKNSLHISGFSLNDGNNYVKLENNRVTNIPQFIYSGTIGGNLETLNNVYIQGTSDLIANQAIYTKSTTLLQYDSIIAPKALIAAIAQDKAQVTYQGVTIVAPKEFRYTTPVPVELPTVKTEPVQAILETTTLNGVSKTVLIYGDKRINLD